MISHLSGTLLESSFTEAVIDVNGVGYQVFIPLSTFEQLPQPGGKVSLYTHLNVREDALQLYGFSTKAERSLFQVLISAVSGVGAKLALNILSGISIDAFMTAVANEDSKYLSKINGIGKKTAERIIVELKDKLPSLSTATMGTGGGNPAGSGGHGLFSQEQLDAIAALEQLQFRRDQAEKAVRSVLEESEGETPSTEQLVRKSLSRLVSSR